MGYRNRLVVAALVTSCLSGCSKDPEAAKREFVRSGDAYVAQKKFAEAVIEYRNAVQQDPQFGEARQKLADALVATGDAVGQLREQIRAADLLPNDPIAQLKAGELLLSARQFEDARSRADKALALRPDLVEAQVLRANALAGLNQLDDAVSQIELAIRTDPDRSSSYASLGFIRILSGDRASAETAFKRAVIADPKSLRARMALANFYWATARPKDAEEHLRGVLEIDPQQPTANQALAYLMMATDRARDAEPFFKTMAAANPGSMLMLADYYFSMQRTQEATATLETLERQDVPESATAKLRLAALGLAKGDAAAAHRLVDEVLAKAPKNADALMAKAQLLAAESKTDEALAMLKVAADAAPQSAQVRLALGNVHLSRREEVEATAAYLEALRLNPRLAPAQVALARIRLASGQTDEAEQLARSAISSVAGYAEAHLLLARIYLVRGAPDKAEPSLRALERSFPDSPAVQMELALLHLSRNNRQAARVALQRVIAKRPSHAGALSYLTQLDLDEKRGNAALARLDSALKADSGNADLMILSSRTHAALGNFSAAEKLAREAISLAPSRLEGYGWLGHLYGAQKKLPEATREYTTVAERKPDSAEAQTTVGMLLLTQNRRSDAVPWFEKAMAADPRAPVAANNLAWIYSEGGGNLDLALKLAQTAKSQLPDAPEVNDTLGWIYLKKGLAALALEPLRQAVAKDPNRAVYHYHLGMAYKAGGDPTKARAALEKALSLDQKFEGADDARQALEGLKR